jgi:uncharacterized damage-inducible protein DinB
MSVHEGWQRRAVWCGAAVVLLAASPAQARQHDHDHGAHEMPAAGLRAELIGNIEQLEAKYMGLAEAMAAHAAWRPGVGVRSTSEVLMHVAAANFMLPTMMGITGPADAAEARETVTDPERVAALLAHSFRHARHAIVRTPDGELDDEITMFGRPATKRALLTLLVNHMHEHLGQLIAYARMNGVAPPWSE